ncbi:MAG: hypothetical protein Q7S15_00250 [bacterium]|nr:hypothetical protein [bacterium]
MDEIAEIYKKTGNLHHAYILEGSRGEIVPKLEQFLIGTLSVKTRGNPDYWYAEYDVMGIDEGRFLKEMHQRKAFGDKKIFVIAANFMTVELQNALLKMLEEPTENTHFFFVTPFPHKLLPTLRSRLAHVAISSEKMAEPLPKDFFRRSKAERLEIIGPIIERKDKTEAIAVLDWFERELHPQIKERRATRDEQFIFSEVLRCRGYLADRSPSIKMILEHISLCLS